MVELAWVVSWYLFFSDLVGPSGVLSSACQDALTSGPLLRKAALFSKEGS